MRIERDPVRRRLHFKNESKLATRTMRADSSGRLGGCTGVSHSRPGLSGRSSPSGLPRSSGWCCGGSVASPGRRRCRASRLRQHPRCRLASGGRTERGARSPEVNPSAAVVDEARTWLAFKIGGGRLMNVFKLSVSLLRRFGRLLTQVVSGGDSYRPPIKVWDHQFESISLITSLEHLASR